MNNGNITSDNRLESVLSILDSEIRRFPLLRQKAENLTKLNFGNRRTLFNPIYVSNICLADCPYCGYRVSNKGLKRRALKPYESVNEAKFLQGRKVENILVLAGDYRHDKYVEMLSANLNAIKKSIEPKWLGIEVATLDTDEYLLLRKSGADSVTVFQETYNVRRYNELHKNQDYKGDYSYRYSSLERAINAGFEEVGLGVLYGVGFWKEDTIAMIEHALYLKSKYPNVRFRFSFPRLKKSIGQDSNCQTEEVNNEILTKIIMAFRIIFPNAMLVLTGREEPEFLVNLLSIVDTVGYDGSTEVGGYTVNKDGPKQFSLNKSLNFDTFREKLIDTGFNV